MTDYNTTQSKPYAAILKEAINEGLHQIKRKPGKLYLSAFSAGLDLGFSILLISAFLTLTKDSLSPLATSLGINLLYTVGFIFVVLGRSELFTEHTTLSIMPVIDKQASVQNLAKVWTIILLGNLTGGLIFALITSRIGPAHGIVDSEIASHVVHNLLSHSNILMFASAVLAGWLMGLLTWLVHASKETMSDILVVILITFSIGFLGLHHSIAGSIEVMLAMFSSNSINLLTFLNFLFWVILGNTVGGVVFVGLLKYSHAKS